MGNQFFDEGNNDDEENNLVPGVSAEELKALEDERSIFEETEVQMAQRILRNNLVASIHSVTKMALNSANERIRLAAAQYVIERNMGRVQDNAPPPADDPIADLLGSVVSEVDMEAIRELATSDGDE